MTSTQPQQKNLVAQAYYKSFPRFSRLLNTFLIVFFRFGYFGGRKWLPVAGGGRYSTLNWVRELILFLFD